MHGNATPGQLLLEVQLRHESYCCRSTQGDAPFCEQADRQIKQCLRLGQIQPAQNFVLNFDRHVCILAAAHSDSKQWPGDLVVKIAQFAALDEEIHRPKSKAVFTRQGKRAKGFSETRPNVQRYEHERPVQLRSLRSATGRPAVLSAVPFHVRLRLAELDPARQLRQPGEF
jgi:hypothetical protein